MKVLYDGEVNITRFRSRKHKTGEENRINWSSLLDVLSTTRVTKESVCEFMEMKKEEQDGIKDVGGFVGGVFRERKRSKESLISRSLLTLDVDYCSAGFFQGIEMLFDFGCCVYSTHKHRSDAPRLRLVIPLSREVSPLEYESISRKLCEEIGMELFDDTTYEPSRLMYFPSTSCDGEFFFEFQDGAWLKVEEWLSKYKDFRDRREWKESSRNKEKFKGICETQQNPREKSGLIGAFCKSYNIHDVIEKFLSDVYERASENRYTYKLGSSFGGVVVYENGDFSFSHHSTDKASNQLCNSFDLVRIHKFSHLDEGKNKLSVNKRPSFKEMLEFSRGDERVREILCEERFSSALSDFSVEDGAWIKGLEIDKHGNFVQSIENIVLILENDSNLKGKIAFNEFSKALTKKGELPWGGKDGEYFNDTDDAQLRNYLEKHYNIKSPHKIFDGILIVGERNKYHPIREYITSTEWDGRRRVETLFIDYLGAEDTKYTRDVTKKTLVGAVARVFSPGIKFDTMLVLMGPQGTGKSHLLSLLGGEWYSDSFITVEGKEAFEQLKEAWIIEVAELSATRKSEVDKVKHFISKREDIYRAAYGRRVTKNPRQCIFIGTTNDYEFLKDRTGNRRFYPLDVGKRSSKKDMWKELTPYEVSQVFAESLVLWNNGETLYLMDEDIKNEALIIQDKHTEGSAKEGMIREYLEKLLPENWYELHIDSRRRYIQGDGEFEGFVGVKKREKVCAMEIWDELFLGDTKSMNPYQAREINDVLRRIEGWNQYEKSNGRMRFGRVYGLQRAFVRE